MVTFYLEESHQNLEEYLSTELASSKLSFLHIVTSSCLSQYKVNFSGSKFVTILIKRDNI